MKQIQLKPDDIDIPKNEMEHVFYKNDKLPKFYDRKTRIITITSWEDEA